RRPDAPDAREGFAAAQESSAASQQRDDGAAASGVAWRLAIGEHVVPLRQPPADLALQHRLAIRRRESLAVNDADAAKSASARVEQEIGQRVARLVGRHAVQIEGSLHDPVSAAQFDEHVGAETAAKKRLLALDLLADV